MMANEHLRIDDYGLQQGQHHMEEGGHVHPNFLRINLRIHLNSMKTIGRKVMLSLSEIGNRFPSFAIQ